MLVAFVHVFRFFCFACVLMLIVCHVAAVQSRDDRVGQNAAVQEHRLSKRKDLDPQTCVENFDIHRDKIIRTEDSREMGAKYLNELDLNSREECLRLCCETDECDVFVFEEKNPGSCYLFRCGPPEDFKCKFTRHNNFTSAVLAISRRLAELEDQIRLTKHEQDLVSLRKQVQVQEEQMLARGTKILSSTTTTSTAPTLAAIYKKHTTASTTAARGCSTFQFECHSSGECIAIYNVCDGVAQCADGSDEAAEMRCPESAVQGGAAPTMESPILAQRPAPRKAITPPQEILPPPQIYDSNDEPIIQKGPPANHPPFMRPVNQINPEQAPWPNRLSQIQLSAQTMQIKPYEDDRRSHIFNHKGGLQVTEAESAAPVQYEYKGIPYENMPDSSWQHRQWPQPNPDQMASNDGRPMYQVDVESGPWKQQAAPVSDNEQRQMDGMIPHLRPMPHQIMEKYDDRGSDNFIVGKNKMWPIPQAPLQTSASQRYPDVMSNSPRTYVMQMDHTLQGNNNNFKELNKNQANPVSSDKPSVNKINKDDPEASNGKKIKNSKNKSTVDNNDSNEGHLKEEPRKNKIKEDDLDADRENTIKETSILVTRKRIIEDDDDDHDGLSPSPPGAIIILIIGLLMTGTMMVMICWRAKLGRRRRRGGKGGFAHDSDYLVNGMYL